MRNLRYVGDSKPHRFLFSLPYLAVVTISTACLLCGPVQGCHLHSEGSVPAAREFCDQNMVLAPTSPRQIIINGSCVEYGELLIPSSRKKLRKRSVGGTFVAGIAFYLLLALFLLASGVEPNPGPSPTQNFSTRLDEEDVPVLLKLTLVRNGRAVKDYERLSYDHKNVRRKQLTAFVNQVCAGNFAGVKRWDAVSSIDQSVLRKYGLKGLLSASASQQQSPCHLQLATPQHAPPAASSPPPDTAAQDLSPAPAGEYQEVLGASGVELMDVDPTAPGVFAAIESEDDDFMAEPLPEGAANFRSSTPVLQNASTDLAFLDELDLPEIEQPTLPEVLRCWVVHTKTPHQHVDLLLKLLKQAGVTGLPETTATLLRHKQLTVTKRRLRSSERSIVAKKAKKRGKIVENPQDIGKFVYFGLREGILNRSPGMDNASIHALLRYTYK